MELNSLDAAILLIVSLSAAAGLMRGLIREVFSLASWIAALLAGWFFSARVAEFFAGAVENAQVRYVVAFGLLAIAVAAAGSLLARMLVEVARKTGLRPADRLAGGAFGAARGAVVVLIMVFVAGPFASRTGLWQDSSLIPYGDGAIEWAWNRLGDLAGDPAGAAL